MDRPAVRRAAGALLVSSRSVSSSRVASAFGLIAGLAQTLGLLRWLIAVGVVLLIGRTKPALGVHIAPRVAPSAAE